MLPKKIVNFRYLGKQKTRDITVNSPEHRFYANGIVVSNSHACSYSVLSAWQLYLKAHYFSEFMCCLLRWTDRAKKKHGESLIGMRVKHAVAHGITVMPPDINKSQTGWYLEDDKVLRIGFESLYGIGKAGEEIVKNQPYKNVTNFLDKSSGLINKSRFETLLFAGCFDTFGDRLDIYNWYHEEYRSGKADKCVESENQMSFDLEIETKAEKKPGVFMTVKELKEREEKAIGFSLDFHFLDKFHAIIEKEGLKTITNVKESEIKYPTIIAKVHEISKFKSNKTGNESMKITLTDGFENANMYMGIDAYELRKKYFEVDKILILPVMVSMNNRNNYSLSKKDDMEIKEVKA